MKITRLLDPLPVPGNGGTTAATVAPTQVNGEGFQPAPNVEEPADNFLDDNKPPAPDSSTVPPKPGETVVDPPTTVVPAVAAPTTYSKEQVAELLKLGAGSQPAPANSLPVPLTQEQIDEQLNTFRPTAELLNELGLDGSNPKVVENFTKMASAMVKNAVTVATILAKEEITHLRGEYQPHVEFAQQQQQEYAQAQYFRDNPTHVGLEPLVTQVAQQMQQEGWKAKSVGETFKEVGKRVNDLVTRLKIPVAQPGAAPVVPAPGEVKPASVRMSTVSAGGQGGAGGAGGGKGEKDPEAGIWS